MMWVIGAMWCGYYKLTDTSLVAVLKFNHVNLQLRVKVSEWNSR